MKRNGGKIFYGWFLLGACWLLLACITGIFTNCLNQFVIPVCEALDITRTRFSLISSFTSVSAMVFAPFVGTILEKYNPRLVVSLSGLGAVAGWAFFSFAPRIEMFYGSAILIGIGSNLCGSIVVNILLNNWFHAKKGFAMGFATTGSGFGSMVFNPITSNLIALYGYQTAFRVTALITFLCMLPLLLLFVYKPEYKGLVPYGDDEAGDSFGKNDVKMAQNTGMTRKEALKSTRFWGVVFIGCALCFGAMAMFNHMTPYFAGFGYSNSQAAAFISVISLTMAFAKVVVGWLNDKLGTHKNFSVFMFLSVIGMGSLAFAGRSVAMGYAASFGFGIAFAMTNVFMPLITVHAMGGKDFGNIFGLVSFSMNVIAVFASPFSGLLYDLSGSYRIPQLTCTALYAAALLVGFFVLRHGYDEKSFSKKV